MCVRPGAPLAGGEPALVLSPPTGQAQARVEACRDREQVLSPRGQSGDFALRVLVPPLTPGCPLPRPHGPDAVGRAAAAVQCARQGFPTA